MKEQPNTLQGEAEFLRSRQLHLVLRVIQRWSLWALAITSIAMICLGQATAWSRGLSHDQVRGEVALWRSLGDFARCVRGGDAGALMMVGIVCGVAMPFLRAVVVGAGFVLQRNWLHVTITIVLLAIMVMGWWAP